MRFFSRLLPAALLFLSLAAAAQTYTPKAIRIQAPPGTDTAEVLRIAALPAGQPLTRQAIEEALQRVIDTGLFSDVGYTVDANALVIQLTPSATSQLQPVHFSNFVWWQPAELESLVEARVPAYHGKLPAAGTLTDQVKAALVDLLKQKGVDAAVDARESGQGATAITLSIARPTVIVGTVTLQNPVAALSASVKKFTDRMHGEEFDIDASSTEIHETVRDLYQNAGYLEVTSTPPAYSSPRTDLQGYAVDLTASIHEGAQYHVASFTLKTVPPVSDEELDQAAGIHPGDAASPLAQRIAQGEMQLVYSGHGFLDAQVAIRSAKETAAHTIAYTVTFAPGELYHLSGVDATALPPDQKAAFTRAAPAFLGAPADRQTLGALVKAGGSAVQFNLRPNPSNHTVIVVLQSKKTTPH
jgi:outer membrane protein assembly factor BamA